MSERKNMESKESERKTSNTPDSLIQVQTTDEEEKICNDLSKLKIEDPSGTSLQSSKLYRFVHMTSDWEIVKEQLETIASGVLSCKNILDILWTFVQKFEPNRDVDLDILLSLMTKNKDFSTLCEKTIFPELAKLILRTSQLFPNSFAILSQGMIGKIAFSQEQCACLLAHMFMCTTIDQKHEHLSSPFNFSYLFSQNMHTPQLRQEKLKCLFHYFQRIFANNPNRSLIFHRLGAKPSYHGDLSTEGWAKCETKLHKIKIQPTGKIEDTKNAIEVDFANRFLGGGVLRGGAAQEEIMMITSPETLVGILFMESMLDQEAILIQGAEIYCHYKGYLDKFCFVANHRNSHKEKKENILDRDILALDALNFKNPKVLPQYSEEGVLRELNKAYVGFSGEDGEVKDKLIATGKWGCGVFKGNAQLKLLLQWMASSRAGRNTIFYSFSDFKELKDSEKIIKHLEGKTVGEVYKEVLKICQLMEKDESQSLSIFNLLLS